MAHTIVLLGSAEESRASLILPKVCSVIGSLILGGAAPLCSLDPLQEWQGGLFSGVRETEGDLGIALSREVCLPCLWHQALFCQVGCKETAP